MTNKNHAILKLLNTTLSMAPLTSEKLKQLEYQNVHQLYEDNEDFNIYYGDGLTLQDKTIISSVELRILNKSQDQFLFIMNISNSSFGISDFFSMFPEHRVVVSYKEYNIPFFTYLIETRYYKIFFEFGDKTTNNLSSVSIHSIDKDSNK